LRVFPVLIDSRPDYLGSGAPERSLLLTPVHGSTTLLAHLRQAFEGVTSNSLTVVTTFEPTAGYEAAIREAGGAIEAVVRADRFAESIGVSKPSDWLLVRDARRVSNAPLDLSRIVADVHNDAGWVRHLVTLADSPGGTSERVIVSGDGRVVRIQRYFEKATWAFLADVVCSLLPASTAQIGVSLPLQSLADLRAALAAAAVPSRDLFLDAPVFNLEHEAGLLGLVEGITLGAATTSGLGTLLGLRKHPTTRVVGPVSAGPDVVLEEDSLVVGPTLLGEGSRVGRGAVVAQCVVLPGTGIPNGTILRQQVVTPDRLEPRAALPTSPAPAAGTPRMTGHIVEESPVHPYYFLKRPVETLLAGASLIVLSPLLLLLAALVKLDSRGPVLFGDRREGKGGRVYRCWKFRTMVTGADARQDELKRINQVDGPQFKMDDDPRVTRLGKWLRALNLDELPQLLNVVTGEMSLVGPRPSPFRENQVCVPWREARLSVRPGITGLWQVCRHDRSSGDFHQWIYYDLLYVHHQSPWLDAKIFLATVLTLGGRYSAPLEKLLPRQLFHERRHSPRPPGSAREADLPHSA
jgi:lipopolysaccharide/colanic/teichoic acid biosynthesis glycosyltransferase